nr:MAG TPA_asm: hypothetical protein [Caudoviricetes sp.]
MLLLLVMLTWLLNWLTAAARLNVQLTLLI